MRRWTTLGALSLLAAYLFALSIHASVWDTLGWLVVLGGFGMLVGWASTFDGVVWAYALTVAAGLISLGDIARLSPFTTTMLVIVGGWIWVIPVTGFVYDLVQSQGALSRRVWTTGRLEHIFDATVITLGFAALGLFTSYAVNGRSSDHYGLLAAGVWTGLALYAKYERWSLLWGWLLGWTVAAVAVADWWLELGAYGIAFGVAGLVAAALLLMLAVIGSFSEAQARLDEEFGYDVPAKTRRIELPQILAFGCLVAGVVFAVIVEHRFFTDNAGADFGAAVVGGVLGFCLFGLVVRTTDWMAAHNLLAGGILMLVLFPGAGGLIGYYWPVEGSRAFTVIGAALGTMLALALIDLALKSDQAKPHETALSEAPDTGSVLVP